MALFFHHIGAPGNSDLNRTVERRRSIREVLTAVPRESPDARFFGPSGAVQRAFPDGTFNCWGVPAGAAPVFQNLDVGDVVLLVHSVGDHGRGIRHIALVSAVSDEECWEASRVLWRWPEDDLLYPHLFLFDTEKGHLPWEQFLEDVEYKPNFNPAGRFYRVQPDRVLRWGGSDGYLDYLRTARGFEPLLD